MVKSLQCDHTLGPVTALAILVVGDETYILSGEGPCLKVFERHKPTFLCRERVFESQSVHGIITQQRSDGRTRLIIWGGHKLQASLCEIQEHTIHFDARQEVQASDWILDICFCPEHYLPHDGTRQLEVAAFVTAHNELYSLRWPHNDACSTIAKLSSPLNSLLYCANNKWLSINHLLVAAGTPFGEILVWSCRVDGAGDSSSQVHYVFRRHEGSIFGLHISTGMLLSHHSRKKRFLVSCSDDRTIRVWDISDCTVEQRAQSNSRSLQHRAENTGFGGRDPAQLQPQDLPDTPLSTSWGHSSRIWGVRFVTKEQACGDKRGVSILTIGEDATCQEWLLSWTPKAAHASQLSSEFTYHLNHHKAYSFHEGKNLWAFAWIHRTEDIVEICTGGADGKITWFISGKSTDETAKSLQNEFMSSGLRDDLCRNTVQNSSESSSETTPLSFTNSDNLQYDTCIVPNTLDENEIAIKAHFAQEFSESQNEPQRLHKHLGFFKSYSILDNESILAVDDQGCVLLISWEGPTVGQLWTLLSSTNRTNALPNCAFTHIAHLEALRRWSLVSTVRGSRISFLAGADGAVYYYHHDRRRVHQLQGAAERLTGLFTELTSDGNIHVVQPRLKSTTALYWRIPLEGLLNESHSSQQIQQSRIELIAKFTISSLAVLEQCDLLVLGTRTGSIAVYRMTSLKTPSSEAKEYLVCFQKVHCNDSITAIKDLTEQKTRPCSSGSFLSTGRDGSYKIHEICFNDAPSGKLAIPKLTLAHSLSPLVCSSIEGAYFNQLNELVLYGFRSRYFIVWNESRQSEVMRVECGGAHRTWNFYPSHMTGTVGLFAWTKACEVFIYAQADVSYTTLQEGAHGREIKAVDISCPIPSSRGEDSRILATGAEDTTIRLFEYQSASDESYCAFPFRPVAVIKKHVTGVQAIGWSKCATYLFSSGGCEEFYVWKIRHVSGFGIGVVCEATCPIQSDVPDLRITSFATLSLSGESKDQHTSRKFLVSMNYSDSTTRTFVYDGCEKRFRLLVVGDYTACCLSQVGHLFLGGHLLLCTAGSDGYLAFWDMTKPLERKGFVITEHKLCQGKQEDNTEPERVPVTLKKMVHQSYVRCMTVNTLGETALIATGGDDNAVGFTRVVLDRERDGTLSCSTVLVPKAHACSVTAMVALPLNNAMDQTWQLKIATSGNDQRLRLWSITMRQDDLDMEVQKEVTGHSSVADISSIGLLLDRKMKPKVVIGGVGLELWRI